MDDVALEISQDPYWRRRLFGSSFEKKWPISYKDMMHIPVYLKAAFKEYGLEYYVSKTKYCSEKFDRGMVVFRFESIEFPEVVRYSANHIGEREEEG